MAISLVQIFALNVVAAILLRWIWSRRKLYLVSFKIPGPISLPFVGSLGMLIKVLTNGNLFEVLWDASKTYSGMFCAWLGPYLHIIVTNPEDVESVFCKFVTAKPPPSIGKVWVPAMGNGLLTMTGVGKESPWKEHKKIINPALGANTNKHYFEHVRNNCYRLEEDIDKLCDTGLVDFGNHLLRFCADSVTESMYGLKLNFRSGCYDYVLEAVEIMTDCVFQRILHFWYLFDPIYNISKLGKKQKAATQTIREFSENIYREKIKQKNNNEKNDEGQLSVIGQLLKAQEEGQLTENDVIEEIMNMWNAASDTTGIVIQFALLALAMNKECQDKAFQEIKSFCKGDRNAVIAFQDLGNFPYVDMCIKETLRLFSPGPLALRYATEDFQFKSRDFTVPAGTNLVIISFLTHRDPKIWDEPLIYRPERFSPEETAKRHPFSFYAFSGGPRKCGGRAFAKMLLTTCIIHLLRKFEFQSDWKVRELPLKFDIDVRNEWGYKAKITRRKWD